MFNKVSYILKNRGKSFDPDTDFQLQDNSDGNGPFIKSWDKVKLGAKPTTQELNALDSDVSFATYITSQINKASRPEESKRALRKFALLKTVLLESDSDTLARVDIEKINIAVIGVKHLLRIQFNDEIENMVN
ncbi:MAG TPA: hypothetical protein ENI76_10870 [Ignavibacteria bacterium]|nr:hypothetical protein [Ignavibacteria bacterium]